MKYLFLMGTAFLFNIQAFPQTNSQTEHNFSKEVILTLSIDYLLYLPEDYDESDNKYPLILFLHGSGERGSELSKVKTHGPPKLIDEGKEFQFIVLSPQCPEDMFWNTDLLSALLNEIETNYRVDKNRIYITGLSMGGHGTWSLALSQPNRFAAIAPVCGWSNPTVACTIKHIPIWVFHGAKDIVVPLSASEQMVNKLRSCDAEVRFTVYPEANHDSWTETYNNDELYKWFLEHSLIKE